MVHIKKKKFKTDMLLPVYTSALIEDGLAGSWEWAERLHVWQLRWELILYVMALLG